MDRQKLVSKIEEALTVLNTSDDPKVTSKDIAWFDTLSVDELLDFTTYVSMVANGTITTVQKAIETITAFNSVYYNTDDYSNFVTMLNSKYQDTSTLVTLPNLSDLYGSVTLSDFILDRMDLQGLLKSYVVAYKNIN